MILNEDERSIIQDEQFFALKQSALQKIENELAELCETIKNTLSNHSYNLPEEIDIELGKISKGENYNGLPYRILDFPRLFKQDGIFAYRVMFWWSKGFYFTFHLSGKYLDTYLTSFESRFLKWQTEHVFYYHYDDEWQHEVEAPFYLPIKGISFDVLQEISQKQGYLKIARRLEINQIEDLKLFGLESFKLFFLRR